jgi:hypothetical protein
LLQFHWKNWNLQTWICAKISSSTLSLLRTWQLNYVAWLAPCSAGRRFCACACAPVCTNTCAWFQFQFQKSKHRSAGKIYTVFAPLWPTFLTPL